MKRAILAVFAIAIVVAGAALILNSTRPTRDHASRDAASNTEAAATDADTSTPAEAGKQVYHLEEDGVQREFIVYRPENLPIDQDVPVVFMYHGSGQGGELFYEESHWTDEADANGFMVVFPTGLKYHIYSDEKVIKGEVQEDVTQYQTKWNDFGLERSLDPNYPNQTLADDVGFTRDMVSYIEDHYAVDADRIYASGFSNGGGFVQRLAIEASDLFAAFAPSSAGGITTEGLAESGFAPADTFVPRPMIKMIGASDAKLTHALDVDSFTTSEAAMDDGSVERTYFVDGYLSLLGLSDDYTYDKQGRVASYTFTTPADGATESASQYTLLLVDGMQHIYPNGDNIPLVAADIYWQFFEQYSL